MHTFLRLLFLDECIGRCFFLPFVPNIICLKFYGNLPFPRLRMAHDETYPRLEILNVFNFIWTLIAQNHQHLNQRIQAALYTTAVHNIVHKYQRTQYIASSKDIIHASTQSFFYGIQIILYTKGLCSRHCPQHMLVVLFREFKY